MYWNNLVGESSLVDESVANIIGVFGSNPTKRSTGLSDPTSLQGTRWISGRKCENAVIKNIGVSNILAVINTGWVRLSLW